MSYLKEMCVSVSSIPGCSVIQGEVVVSLAKTFVVQHRNFAMVGSSSWNKLPTSNLQLELFSLSLSLCHKCLRLNFVSDHGFTVFDHEHL